MISRSLLRGWLVAGCVLAIACSILALGGELARAAPPDTAVLEVVPANATDATTLLPACQDGSLVDPVFDAPIEPPCGDPISAGAATAGIGVGTTSLAQELAPAPALPLPAMPTTGRPHVASALGPGSTAALGIGVLLILVGIGLRWQAARLASPKQPRVASSLALTGMTIAAGAAEMTAAARARVSAGVSYARHWPDGALPGASRREVSARRVWPVTTTAPQSMMDTVTSLASQWPWRVITARSHAAPVTACPLDASLLQGSDYRDGRASWRLIQQIRQSRYTWWTPKLSSIVRYIAAIGNQARASPEAIAPRFFALCLNTLAA